MRARRRDELLRSLLWPEVRIVEDLSLRSNDVIIMSAGFEDRSTAVLKRVVSDGSRGFVVLCADYLPAVEENRRAEVAALCERAEAELYLVTYDRENPAGAASEFLAKVPVGASLYVDISGMSRLLILQLLTEILRTGNGGRTHVLYTEAHYPPSREEFSVRAETMADPLGVSMFLSSGVFGLTVVPELSSVAMQGQPIRVVLFPSWNASQMIAICAEIQASFFTVIHGRSPSPDHEWRLDALRTINRVESLPGLEERTTSTLDYRETLIALLDVYADHAQREKMLVVPTGSKMQSVAVAIARSWLGDLQIAYPTPRSFATPSDYTRGSKSIYVLSLLAFSPA